LLRHGAEMGLALRKAGAAIVAAAVGVQILSVTVWHPLEIEQMQSMGKPVFIIGLRLVNTVAIVLGKMDAWHLTNMYTKEYGTFHAKTLYFYPFIISQRHHLPSWFSMAIVAAWIALVAVLLYILFQIRKQARLGWNMPVASRPTLQVNTKISTFEHSQEQA